MGDADKLRVLATWFDDFDDWREKTGKIAPGIAEYREVQGDLRRMAANLDLHAALVEAARNYLLALDHPLAAPYSRSIALDLLRAALIEEARNG
jgi:hypothetical protein